MFQCEIAQVIAQLISSRFFYFIFMVMTSVSEHRNASYTNSIEKRSSRSQRRTRLMQCRFAEKYGASVTLKQEFTT